MPSTVINVIVMWTETKNPLQGYKIDCTSFGGFHAYR